MPSHPNFLSFIHPRRRNTNSEHEPAMGIYKREQDPSRSLLAAGPPCKRTSATTTREPFLPRCWSALNCSRTACHGSCAPTPRACAGPKIPSRSHDQELHFLQCSGSRHPFFTSGRARSVCPSLFPVPLYITADSSNGCFLSSYEPACPIIQLCECQTGRSRAYS
ncbi:uncharacterized protein EI97DRAFT_171876 [Westerdykella ornata]|uniref:Uncharacterized protein n=1 Tax=Westerdykella ornata TaxID=318751 RepID=A0A6A6JRP5_WESOR|nr:uncharacterized protein EI97DRAFT_171876 [Westerdykella ornata]KAF2279291.1 hypothetical protein EI97DRAFT_171876 [Westerdykella ornata]